MKPLFTLVCCFTFGVLLQAQQTLTLYPNIHTMGFQVALQANFDPDSNAICRVRYHKKGENFKDGFPASLINNYGKKEFRGSLFFLEPATLYIVEITVTDSFPVVQTFTLTDSITTRSDPKMVITSTFKYVSPTGTGTQYTNSNPGNLKTLLASGISCGTTVILKGGTYSTGDMQLNLLNDCSSGNPIIIRAADNEQPIIDGGDYTQYTWTKSGSDTNLYFATIKPELEYNSLCLFNGQRLYPYGFLTPPSLDPSYPNLTNLNYDLSGFYRNANLVYIKTLDHKNPNSANIVFSKYFYCLQVQGNKRNNFIYLKGISFKNYGKGSCNKDIFGNPTCYPSFTLDFENASNVVIDSCTFEYCNIPIGFAHRCNNNIVQNCTITDGVGLWSHGAFKQTRDELLIERGTYGRYLEYSAINMFPDDTIAKGNIFRNNTVYGSIGGLVGQRIATYEGIEETDIYNNKVSYCYNGINADGGSNNTRIWNNEIDHCSVGLSFISALTGPNYILRNNVHHIIERKNHHFDVFFMNCNNVLSEKIWGTGVKLNASAKTNNPPELFFVNNTFHTLDSIGFCMYLWNSTWKKLYSRNNIFYSEGMSSLFFDGPKDDPTYSFNSAYDCYYNKTNGKAATVQPTNGIPVCNQYATGAALGNALKSISTSNGVMVSNDYNVNPGFKMDHLDFHLINNSVLVNQGILVKGLNDDYKGMSPDIGAFETDTTGASGISSSAINNEKRWHLYPNPSGSTIYLLFDAENLQSKTSVSIINLLGQTIKEFDIESSQSKMDISGLPSGIYLMQIGNETLRFIKL